VDRSHIRVVLLEPVLQGDAAADATARGTVLADLRDTPRTRPGVAGGAGAAAAAAGEAGRPRLQRRMSRVFEYGVDVDQLPAVDTTARPPTPEPAALGAGTPGGGSSSSTTLASPHSGSLGRVESIVRKHKAMEQHAQWDTLRRVSASRMLPNAFSSLSRAMLASLGTTATNNSSNSGSGSRSGGSADQQDTDQLQLLFDSIDTNHDQFVEVRFH
jgi:hypothetical protein